LDGVVKAFGHVLGVLLRVETSVRQIKTKHLECQLSAMVQIDFDTRSTE